MSFKIPLFRTYNDESDLKHIQKVITSSMNWSIGSSVIDFESLLSDYIGSKYCVTFNSGTSALYSTLLAEKIGTGDEVIVPSFSFIATANAPLFVGAKPIFADIEQKTLGLDPNDVINRITAKTKAIIAVHYGGRPCRIKEIKEIAKDNNLILIEDAAEALGASINNRKIGTFGDSSIFSFCQNKIISTGEGGASLTNSRHIYERMKLIRSHGRDESKSDYFSSVHQNDYVSLGYNFRLSNILASLGVSQIKKVDWIIKQRRKKAFFYNSKLTELGEVVKAPDGYFNVYQFYTIRVDENMRDNLQIELAKKGIMTKVYFPPIHLTKFYRDNLGHFEGELPVTEQISKEVLTLPLYVSLKESEIDYIVKSISEIIN